MRRSCRGGAFAGALFLAACSHVGGPSESEQMPGAPAASPEVLESHTFSAASTAAGNYLAGRFAGAMRDTRRAARYYALALQQDPSNDVILDRAFLLELAGGQVESGIARANDIVKRDPTKRIAQLVLGLQSAVHANWADARTHLNASASGPFNTLSSTLISAWTYEGEGLTDEALATLATIKRSQAFDIFRVFHAALILDHAGRNQEADKAYKALIASGGGAALRIVQAYGNFLERQGRLKEAEQLYSDFSANAPDNPLIEFALGHSNGNPPPRLVASVQDGIAEVLYGLASALAQDRSVDLPIIYLQLALYVRPDFDVAQFLLGDLLTSLEHWRDANTAYEAIDASSPLRETADIQRALNLDHIGQTDKAITLLQKIANHSTAPSPALVSLGDLLRSRERFQEAAEAYSRAIALVSSPGPLHWALFYARGVSYERAGRWDLAEKDLLEARKLDGDQALVLNYLGYSWIEKGEHLQEALKMIERAVELSPDDGYIVDSLGWAYFKLGKFDRAVEYIERAVSLRPEDPTINSHLGDAYWRAGRTIEARFQWRHAIALGADKQDIPILERKINFGLESQVRTGSGAMSGR